MYSLAHPFAINQPATKGINANIKYAQSQKKQQDFHWLLGDIPEFSVGLLKYFDRNTSNDSWNTAAISRVGKRNIVFKEKSTKIWIFTLFI